MAAYVGAAFAIVFGLVLLWFPPAILSGQAATAGTALAFITGGLSALGVTVAIPAVRESATREGYVKGHADGKANLDPAM